MAWTLTPAERASFRTIAAGGRIEGASNSVISGSWRDCHSRLATSMAEAPRVEIGYPATVVVTVRDNVLAELWRRMRAVTTEAVAAAINSAAAETIAAEVRSERL